MQKALRAKPHKVKHLFSDEQGSPFFSASLLFERGVRTFKIEVQQIDGWCGHHLLPNL